MHLKTMEHSIVPQQNNDPDLYRISLKKQQHRQVCKQHVHVYLSDTQTNNKKQTVSHTLYETTTLWQQRRLFVEIVSLFSQKL